MGWIFVLVSFVLNASAVNPKVLKQHLRAKKNALGTTEATVHFDHRVYLRSRSKPTRERQLKQADEHVAHLFGPLSEAKLYAVPKSDHRISNLQLERDPEDPQRWIVRYHYQGTMLIKAGDDSKFVMTLPLDPTLIYEASAVRRNGKKTYPCTDEDYDGVEDFWYFWNPRKPGCKLKYGVDYVDFKATSIDRIPNIRKSYPDYPRLVNDEGVIRMDFLVGMDEHKSTKKNRNPFRSDDLNAETYRSMRKALVEDMGFTEPEAPWTEDEIRAIAPRVHLKYLPWVETFTKETKRGVTLEVRLFYGPSGMGERDVKAFQQFMADAFENTSVLVYDGHSGLGGNLELEAMEKNIDHRVQFPKSKYQIYFFNSCSSYTYYNGTYMERKGGTENLDIMVNGLATAFEALGAANIAVVRGIDRWAAKEKPYSYQDLIRIIDSENLFSVAGDEDNPTRLQDIQ